jgi:hypothetical protein
VTSEFFIKNAKAQKLAQERASANHSAALARESMIAAQKSANAAKFAAWAAVAAALGAIAQAIASQEGATPKPRAVAGPISDDR